MWCCVMIAVIAVETANVPSEEVVQRFEDRSIMYTGGEYRDEGFHYRLLRPAQVEAGVKYPLVLFLHGAGERGDDNIKQLKYLPEQMSSEPWRAKYPCFLIAPQCRSGKKWVDVAWDDTKSVPHGEPTDQTNVVNAILDQALAELPVDSKRVYLTGLSMGGYGTWFLAARRPELFAAAAPICGGGDERTAAHLVKLPIWAFHGDADNVVPPERSRKMIEAVRAAGGMPKYTEFPSVAHDSWTPAYRDENGLIPWLFEQRR